MDRRTSLRDAMKAAQAQRGKAGSNKHPNAAAYRTARKSGQLNLSSREIKAFPTEILRLHQLVEEDEKSWECASLQKIDLSYNDIPELPSEVSGFPYLTSFKIRHNQLQTLPETFWDLTTLTSLDLSNNLLEGTLSESIGQLVNLRELGLEGNKLVRLPESIQLLQQLEVLRIENNRLQALPSHIGNLSQLHTLTAHTNEIVALPSSFGSLSKLVTLDLKKNKLRTTGDAFIHLGSVTYIDVRQNRLEIFPRLPTAKCVLAQLFVGFNCLTSIEEDSIVSAKDSLTVLDVRDNKLHSVPDKIAHLYRVKTLDMSNNDLHDLPPGLGYLKYLNHLMVDGNPLRSIRRSIISSGTEALKKYLRTRGSPPEGVEALEEELDEFSLRQREQEEDKHFTAAGTVSSQHEYIFRDASTSGSLQLIDMRLEALPDLIQGSGKYNFASTLTQLNLSKNRLGTLAKEVGELRSLQTLIAEECDIKSIHSSISTLGQLQYLRLTKNLLTSDAINDFLKLGEQAQICSSLKELDLRNNQLKEVPGRLQFLTAVDTLLLSYNKIRTLAGFPWSLMRNLTVLSLRDNQLESLGTVYEVKLLTALSIENNNLRQIPAKLGLCEHLRQLYIVGNPQRGIRTVIISEGTEAILKYLRNRLPPELLAAKSESLSLPTDEMEVDTENIPPPNQNATIARNLDSTNAAKRIRMSTSQIKPPQVPELSNSSVPRAPKIQQPKPALPNANPVNNDAPTAATASSGSADDTVLAELEVKIAGLENQLDDCSITNAKRFALKKDLAMARSLKIRHLRKVQSQQ